MSIRTIEKRQSSSHSLRRTSDMRIMQITTLRFLLVSVVPSAMIMNRSFLAPLQAHAPFIIGLLFCDMVIKNLQHSELEAGRKV